METNPSGTVSYTTDSNSLITAVSELQEYIFSNRSVSAVNTGDGDQDGAYKADRNINTGYIPNQSSLSNTYNRKVITERTKQIAKLGDGNGSKTGNDLDNLKEINQQNSKFKSKIKALNEKVINENNEGDDNDESEEDSDTFGGNQYKKKY